MCRRTAVHQQALRIKIRYNLNSCQNYSGGCFAVCCKASHSGLIYVKRGILGERPLGFTRERWRSG